MGKEKSGKANARGVLLSLSIERRLGFSWGSSVDRARLPEARE